MADASLVIRLSEQRNIYATFTPATGTLTLSSATVTLYDHTETVAGSVSGTTATGITSGASAAPMAWYLLKPSVLGLTPGTYTLVIKATDSSGYVYEAAVCVVVREDAAP